MELQVLQSNHDKEKSYTCRTLSVYKLIKNWVYKLGKHSTRDDLPPFPPRTLFPLAETYPSLDPLLSRRTRRDGGHDGGYGGRHSTSSILSENQTRRRTWRRIWRQTQYILYSLGEPSSPLQLSDMEPLSRHDGRHDGGYGGRHSTSFISPDLWLGLQLDT